MTTDNRTVFTDALKTLGLRHKVEEGTRDAIHIAGRVCRAAQILAPGQRVGRLEDGRYGVPTVGEKVFGIVDPFLTGFVAENEVFWLMIFPRTITALRHVWDHPDFPADPTAADIKLAETIAKESKFAEAKAWLEGFWIKIDCDSYDHMMEIADGFVETGCHLVEENRWESARSVLWDNQVKFWDSYEVVRGVTLTEEQRGGIFCCSC